MAKIFGYKNFHFDFLGKKKIFYIIALLFIIPGLIVLCFSGLNSGLEFTGGSILEVAFDKPVALEDVRAIVSEMTSMTPSINESGTSGFIIRTEELEEEESQAIVSALDELGGVTVVRSARIGPTIGRELLANARWALIIACALMLLYITFRFRFNFALSAVICLLNDALVMVSLFAIFRLEVDSSFIAAVLTVIGYSINNTIVIFDRIRENSSTMSDKRSRRELINSSINQTLTRSINTTMAVLLLLFCLLIFGGTTTRVFMIALIIGILAGFYSSVFLVGNILEDLYKYLPKSLGGDRRPKVVAKATKKPAPAK